MYVLALINTSLAQGGVAYYLHRKAGVSFLSALSSVLFIAMLEIYQLFLFSTLGVIFYTPVGAAQMRIVAILRVVYIAAWAMLAGVMIFFAVARRSARIRNWVETGRAGALLATFIQARPLDYLMVLAIKAPTFLASVVAQYYALALYGIAIPFVKLMLFLAAGVSGRRAADFGRASRHQPGGVAAVLLDQRDAGEDRRLQPGGATHVHVVQRADWAGVPAAREPRADRAARRGREQFCDRLGFIARRGQENPRAEPLQRVCDRE